MRNKLLLIIDPQIDFITGTLKVPGAESAMDALAGYIDRRKDEYTYIIVTADRHPINHCSFQSNGGEWPRHCVADSMGAAIWPPIMEVLMTMPGKVEILHKGEDPRSEEYSIFKNEAASERLLNIIVSNDIRQIDICGLAGDFCVAETIVDAIANGLGREINVLYNFTPSIDGGNTLNALIKNNDLSCVR